MLPIRDHNPSTKFAFVTYALIVINIAVHVMVVATVQSDRELFDFYTEYAMIPARLSNGENFPSLVTSVFLHGDFMHLAGNMLFL